MDGFTISENKLEDIIYSHLMGECENESLSGVFEKEYCEGCHIVKRQLQIGGYGIADIVAFDTDAAGGVCSVTITELKKGVVDSSTVAQTMRYKAGLKHFLEDLTPMCEFRVAVVLIGRYIHESDGTGYMPLSIRGLSIATYDITGAGVEFKPHGGWYHYNLPFSRDLKKIATCIDYTCFDTFCAHDNHFFKKGEKDPGRMVR